MDFTNEYNLIAWALADEREYAAQIEHLKNTIKSIERKQSDNRLRLGELMKMRSSSWCSVEDCAVRKLGEEYFQSLKKIPRVQQYDQPKE